MRLLLEEAGEAAVPRVLSFPWVCPIVSLPFAPHRQGGGRASSSMPGVPWGGHIGIWGRVKRGGSGSGSRPAAVLIPVLEVQRPELDAQIWALHHRQHPGPRCWSNPDPSHDWDIPDPGAGTSPVPWLEHP